MTLRSFGLGSDGVTYTVVTANGVTSIPGAQTFVGFINVASSSQSVTIQAFDSNNGTGNAITPPITLGAGQVFLVPYNGLRLKSGQLSVTTSGAPTTAINVLHISSHDLQPF